MSHYKLPLHYDEFGALAWTDDENLAISFDFSLSDDYCESIVKCINGEIELSIDDLRFDVVDFYIGDKYIFSIRGWGNLTGVGAKNLSEDKVAAIQDEFRDFVFNKLKG